MDRTVRPVEKLHHFCVVDLNRLIDVDRNFYAFPLGTNTELFAAPPDYKPLRGYWIGEPIEMDGRRVDSPDFGTSWSLQFHPGMGLTFGPPGSGKTSSLLVPAALVYGASAVFTDPGGELAWITADQRRRMGHLVAIVDPFGIVQKDHADPAGVQEQTIRYNPLAELHPGSAGFAERIATISDALSVERDINGSFISGMVRQVIEGTIADLCASIPGIATLGDVRRRLKLPLDDFIATSADVVRHAPSGLAAEKLGAFLRMESRTQQVVLLTASEQTKFLDDEQLASCFSPANGESHLQF